MEEIILAQTGHGEEAEHAVEAVNGAAAEAAHGAAGHGDVFEFSQLFHHMEDTVLLQLPSFSIGSLTIDLSITKLVLMMILSGGITLLAFGALARKIRGGAAPRGILANLTEALFDFVNRDMIIGMMGEKAGRQFAPYFTSLFFFILFANLIGLIPFMGTATSNIAVTASLAVLTFFITQVSAVRVQGIVPYMKHHVPPGMPIFLIPIMVPIEILGHFIKPFALTIRLFANMTGGHVVILSVIGMLFLFKSLMLAPLVVGFVLFIDFLELLVAFIQAYVFVLLSILFVNAAIQPEH